MQLAAAGKEGLRGVVSEFVAGLQLLNAEIENFLIPHHGRVSGRQRRGVSCEIPISAEGRYWIFMSLSLSFRDETRFVVVTNRVSIVVSCAFRTPVAKAFSVRFTLASKRLLALVRVYCFVGEHLVIEASVPAQHEAAHHIGAKLFEPGKRELSEGSQYAVVIR